MFSCLIILVHQGLPFLDYPNHLARYYMLTRDFGTPLYNQYYANNFRIIPNIGVDFLMAGLGRVVDPAIGLRLLLAGTICFACYGYSKLSRLRNIGDWHPALIILPVTLFSFSFILGFLNFVLASSLLPYAIYLYEKHEGRTTRIAIVLASVLILFFCHMMVAVLFLLVIIAAPKSKEKAVGIATVVGSLVLMAVLYKLSSVSEEHSVIVLSTVAEKFKFFFSSMAFGPWWMISNGLSFLALAVLFFLGYPALEKQDRVLLLSLFVFYILCPEGFKLSGNFDGRVPPLIFSLIIATSKLKPFQVGNRFQILTYGLFAVLTVNLVSVFAVIRRSDVEAHKMRDILMKVPTGEALFIADISQWSAIHRGHWYPAYKMMPFYTAMDRPLFISGIFTFSSQQPIVLKPGLEKLGFATQIYKPSDSVDFQVKKSMSDLQTRFELLKSIGVKQSWVFFVNYESTGYDGVQVPGTVYVDRNYLLAHIDN